MLIELYLILAGWDAVILIGHNGTPDIGILPIGTLNKSLGTGKNEENKALKTRQVKKKLPV